MFSAVRVVDLVKGPGFVLVGQVSKLHVDFTKYFYSEALPVCCNSEEKSIINLGSKENLKHAF